MLSSSSKQAVKRGGITEWNPSRGTAVSRSTNGRNPRKHQECKLLKLAGAQGGLWGMAGNGGGEMKQSDNYEGLV